MNPFEDLADCGYDELELIRWTTKKGQSDERWLIRAAEGSRESGGVGFGNTPEEAAENLLYIIAVKEGDGK